VDRKAIVTIPKKVALCCLENIHACIPPNKRDWNFLRVKEGSPVHKNAHAVSSMSRAGHVVSCLNMGGPSSKAKYS